MLEHRKVNDGIRKGNKHGKKTRKESSRSSREFI